MEAVAGAAMAPGMRNVVDLYALARNQAGLSGIQEWRSFCFKSLAGAR